MAAKSRHHPVHKMQCCGRNIHLACFRGWFLFNATCIFCETVVDSNTLKMLNSIGSGKKVSSPVKKLLSPVKTEQAELLLQLKKGSSDEERPTAIEVARKEASAKKRRRQDSQAESMKKRRLRHVTAGLKIGAIVVVKVDHRDVYHARGVPGIVFDFSESSGGVQVVTEYGVIAEGVSKSKYYIPSDRYVVKNDDVLISENLAAIRESVLASTFDVDNTERVTLRAAHAAMVGVSPAVRRGCRCRSKCTARCGCCRANAACTSQCSCSGNCDNPHN